MSKRLFAFGAGMAVGFSAGIGLRATLPRATEFAGLLLEKLGFEITDLILALWDPEANTTQAALPAPKVIPPAKKRRRPATARRTAAPVPFQTARRNSKSRSRALAALN